MDDRSLQNLLREADGATCDSPHPAAGLAARVRSLQRRRRTQKAVGGVGIAGLAVVVAFALFQRGPGATGGLSANAPKEPANRDIQTLVNEHSQLAAQADSQARVAGRLIKLIERDRRIEALRRERRGPDALILAREELDKAAFRLIVRADDLRERQDDKDAAIATYREVVRLFPETQSAVIARRSLADIANEKRGML